AEDGIRDFHVTGVQTCALPILSLFQEYGVQKVTIAEIAKKAHVSQVTIYNYFESKDNLVYHVFKYYVDNIWEEQKEMLESDIPRSEEHTSELQSRENLVCRLLL